VEDYLHFLEKDKGRKHSTLVRYRTLYDIWLAPTLGGRRAESLLPGHLERALGIMRRAGQSASSIHQAFTVLNGAFKWAKRNRRISRNPMVDVEKPQSMKASNEIIPPDIDALLALLAAAFDDEFESESPVISERSPACDGASWPASSGNELISMPVRFSLDDGERCRRPGGDRQLHEDPPRTLGRH